MSYIKIKKIKLENELFGMPFISLFYRSAFVHWEAEEKLFQPSVIINVKSLSVGLKRRYVSEILISSIKYKQLVRL